MGDIEKRINQLWEKPPDLDEIKEFILVNHMRIPELSLKYEEGAYRALGRNEKADVIAQYSRYT